MKTRVLQLLLLLSLVSFSIFAKFNLNNGTPHSSSVFQKDAAVQAGLRVLLPVFVRLQALQNVNITLWQSLPQNFSDHVATINSKILATFISSNSLGFNLSRDSVANLWIAAKYSLQAGDYVSTLTWVSSQTIRENLTSLGSPPFPQNYPEDVKIFLDPGKKVPTKNQTIQDIAAAHKQIQNMTQTVQNTLDFVVRQNYDPAKTRLLMSGNLTTTDILDFFKDALQVHDTNSSICVERSWYATTILRAAGVPTRTVTDVRLKTWIQVWLPNNGWVDAETLCPEPLPHVGMLPKSISAHAPWIVENSSDATFPFTWLPKVPMKVANLTFGDPTLFHANEYKTVLSEPVDEELFKKDETKYRFPLVSQPETVYAAVTRKGSDLMFTLLGKNENVSKVLTLGESNTVSLGDVSVSFRPTLQGDFLILHDFAVQAIWKFDTRLLVPIVGVSAIILAVWLLRSKRKHTR